MPQVLDAARSLAQVDTLRLEGLLGLARERALDGPFIELGVYQGGSALALALALDEVQSPHQVHLLDSWRGLPALGPEDRGCVARQGTFGNASEAQVSALLRSWGLLARCQLHSGWISDTLPALHGPFALAHVDLDLYGPTLQALEHLLPRMTAFGAIVVDDFEGGRFPGVSRAVGQALDQRHVGRWRIARTLGERDHAAVLLRDFT